MLNTIILLLVVTQGIVCYVLYLGRKRYLKDYKYIKEQNLSTIKEIYNLKHDIEDDISSIRKRLDVRENISERLERDINNLNKDVYKDITAWMDATVDNEKDIGKLKQSLENIVYKTKAIDEWIDKQAWEKLKKDKPNLTFFPIES